MKRLIRILPLLAIILISACHNNAQTAEQMAEDIPLKVFQEKLKNLEDVQLLDVRRPEEWAEGIIEDALTINWFDENFGNQITILDKEKPVLVYCASGGRSGKAMSLMKEQGFKEVYNLEGGIGAWNEAGLPTIKN